MGDCELMILRDNPTNHNKVDQEKETMLVNITKVTFMVELAAKWLIDQHTPVGYHSLTGSWSELMADLPHGGVLGLSG